MPEAAWIVAGLVSVVVLLGGAIITDNRGRIGNLETEMKRMDIESSRIRLEGFSRLSKVEEALEGIREAIAEFRAENRARHDRTDGRLDSIEREIKRSNGRS